MTGPQSVGAWLLRNGRRIPLSATLTVDGGEVELTLAGKAWRFDRALLTSDGDAWTSKGDVLGFPVRHSESGRPFRRLLLVGAVASALVDLDGGDVARLLSASPESL